MLGDTIFAVASPPGSGERGVIRVSGPSARAVVDALIDRPLDAGRGSCTRRIEVSGFPVEVFALTMPGPNSFTGEDVVELHLPGSPLLLARVQDQLRGPARDATPGEFTRRAFENGRLSLAEAESVSDLIHAASSEQRRFALDVLCGGVSQSVERCRSSIQDGVAMLEAGLDFEAGETGEVDAQLWIGLLSAARSEIEQLRAAIPQAHAVGDVILLGCANAGKSSLCNALAGRDALLVSDVAGTTRDLLSVDVGGGVTVLDAPGDLGDATGIDATALALRDRVAGRVASAVLVVDASAPVVPPTDLPVLAVVFTKCDLADPATNLAPAGTSTFVVSNLDGRGIDGLREFLHRSVASGPSGAAARIADQLERSSAALARAIEAGEAGLPPEVVACDAAEALAAVDGIAGRSSPEDLLDRIFGRFCLGK